MIDLFCKGRNGQMNICVLLLVKINSIIWPFCKEIFVIDFKQISAKMKKRKIMVLCYVLYLFRLCMVLYLVKEKKKKNYKVKPMPDYGL